MRLKLLFVALSLVSFGCTGDKSSVEVGGDLDRLHGVWHAYVMEGLEFTIPSKFVWHIHENGTITQPPLLGSGHKLVGPEINYTATADGGISLHVSRETTPGGVFSGTWRIIGDELILEGAYPGGEVIESRFRRLALDEYASQASEAE